MENYSEIIILLNLWTYKSKVYKTLLYFCEARLGFVGTYIFILVIFLMISIMEKAENIVWSAKL